MWAALEICRQFLAPSVAPETPPTSAPARMVWPVRPEDDKRSASDDQQVTKRSAESVPPEPRGLRGRGGERPFSNCESAPSAANWRERGSEMNPQDFGHSKCSQIDGTPENMRADVLGLEKDTCLLKNVA